MELALQILLVLVALICLGGGMNLLVKGAGAFSGTTKPPAALDNLFRFLSGIYFGLGLLMAWVVFNFHQLNDLIYFLGIVVIFSGLGRLYSRTKVGSAGNYFDNMMVIEIILGLAIILLQYFRVK